LVATCILQANYYSLFLLLGDVSCPEHLVDAITQVVLYDCPILGVLARHSQVHFTVHPLVWLCFKELLEHSPIRSVQIAVDYLHRCFYAGIFRLYRVVHFA